MVTDEEAVITWARQCKPEPDQDFRTPQQMWPTNELVATTGEIPDRGVEIQPEKETFYVR